MKILILSDFFDDRGGAIGFAKNLALSLVQAGHRVGLIATVRNKNLEGRKNIDGLEVFFIYSDYNLFWRPYRCLYNPMTIGRVKAVIDEFKPEIVHANNIHIHLSYHCLRLAKLAGAKVFMTAHDVQLFHYGKLTEFINPTDLSCPTDFNYKISAWQLIKKAGKTYNPFRNFAIRQYLKNVDRIFSVSDAQKKALSDNGILNVETIHSGIDAEAWQIPEKSVEEFRKNFGLEGRHPILFGGRLNEAKGSREIILALAEVAKSNPKAILLVVGKTDKETEKIMSLAKKNKLTDKVVFTGWQTGDGLKAAYHSCRIVTVPSICFDSFPMTVLEAMACKKPVIATCFGGSREAVTDGTTGFIVNPFNVSDLSNKISRLLGEDGEKFGEVGYERIVKEFKQEKMAAEYLERYREYLND